MKIAAVALHRSSYPSKLKEPCHLEGGLELRVAKREWFGDSSSTVSLHVQDVVRDAVLHRRMLALLPDLPRHGDEPLPGSRGQYPPTDLFERVSEDPAVWDVLIELEQLTSPRVRDAVGIISLLPPQRRVSGPNASWAMASFTHIDPKGSRFSDGRCASP